LAEDGLDNRELIQAILQRAGARVGTAENGHLAIEKMNEQSFDLILMDMNMPEMDGYEATALLRDRGHQGPIVALTANAMIGDSERCREAGCNAYLTKPIDRWLLIKTIATLVDTKAAAARAIASGEAAIRPPPESIPAVAASSQGAAVGGEGLLVSEYADDPDMALIIQRFIGRLAEQLDAMRQTQASHAHEDLRRLAHKLKGAGGSYGYPRLTDACRVLEDAAQIQDEAAEAAAVEDVAALIHAIQNAYSDNCAEGATP
jgi:CheY-like chemotaxis protein